MRIGPLVLITHSKRKQETTSDAQSQQREYALTCLLSEAHCLQILIDVACCGCGGTVCIKEMQDALSGHNVVEGKEFESTT